MKNPRRGDRSRRRSPGSNSPAGKSAGPESLSDSNSSSQEIEANRPHALSPAPNPGGPDKPSEGKRRRPHRRRLRRSPRSRDRRNGNGRAVGDEGPGTLNDSVVKFPAIEGVPLLVDTHAHLEASDFDPDRKGVLDRANSQGVRFVIAVGSDVKSSRKSLEIAAAYANVYAAVGVHPNEAKSVGKRTLATIASFLENPKAVAIGEIGLDYYRNHSPPKLQRHWFREQLRLAVKVQKPVIVHCRSADEDLYNILNEERVWRAGGVLHCFTGDGEFAKKLLGLDLYLGAAGPLAFEKSADLRKVFEGIPIERILVETDSPYLSPPPDRGKRNEPGHVARVAQALADVFGLTVEEVARITTNNARRIFGFEVENGGPVIAYRMEEKLYLNISGQCSNSCFFCARLTDFYYKGFDLSLKEEEPNVDAILEAAGDPSRYEEIVFSGLGEPTLRLDILKEVAKGLRERGARRIRLVTNGLGNKTNGRNIFPELRGLVDAISVSLQADSAETYMKVCKTEGIEEPFSVVKDFIRRARTYYPDVEATAVDMPGIIDIDSCERVAREELGVSFRRRAYTLAD